MATVHMNDRDVTSNFEVVLDNIRQGAEVIVEQDNLPVAVIGPPRRTGRLLSEAIAIAKARGSKATLDQEFMKDVEEGIAARSQPWNPPAWE